MYTCGNVYWSCSVSSLIINFVFLNALQMVWLDAD